MIKWLVKISLQESTSWDCETVMQGEYIRDLLPQIKRVFKEEFDPSNKMDEYELEENLAYEITRI